MERHTEEETSTALPRQLGSYLLVKQLGRGGMGNVFLALQHLEIFERPCVIKLIRGRLVGHEHHRRRFLDEARTTLSLSHRNVSRVLDVGAEGGTIYLAMEYVAGRDLRTVLGRCIERGERVPQSIAIYILAELLEALEAAHGNVDPVSGAPMSIVHRDVSPHNVMIGFDGGIKLIDFGVASTTAASAQTDPGIVVGKTTYMAPEQAAGEAVAGAADVFATAVLGVELFLSSRYYGGKSVDDIGAALEDTRYRPPDFAALPDALRAAFDAALARAPAQRPSAGALADRLRAWGAEQGQVAGAADVRAFMQRLFPGEETAERRVHQDLMRGAHALADSIDATDSGSREDTAATAHARPRRGAAPAPEVVAAVTPPPPRARVRRAQLVLAAALVVAVLVAVAASRRDAARRDGAPSSSSAAAAYRAGVSHMRALEFVAARTRLEKAVKLDPGHAMSHVRLAQLLFEGGMFLDAKVAAMRAWDLRDGLPSWQRDLVDAVHAEASRDWPAAIDALSRRAAAPDVAADDLVELARVHIAAGRSADALTTLSRLRQHADAPRALSRLLLLEAAAARNVGDLDRALVAARAARVDAEGRGGEALVAAASYEEGRALAESGDNVAAKAQLLDASRRFEALGDRGAHAAALLALGAVSDPERSREQEAKMLEDALALFREARDIEGEALALNNLAATYEASADAHRHRELLTRALALGREIGDQDAIATTALNLGLALAFDSDLEGGLRYANEALAAARATTDVVDVAWALAGVAQVEVMRGDLAAAKAHVDEASTLVRGAAASETRAYVALVRGDLLLSLGAYADALAAFREVGAVVSSGLEGWATVGAARAQLASGSRPALDPLLALRAAVPERSTDLELAVVIGLAALDADDENTAQQALDHARAVLAKQSGLTLRGMADDLEARLRASRGDREGALEQLRNAAQVARGIGALPIAIELELSLAERGDKSRLASARQDAERIGALGLVSRADRLARR